MNFREWLKEQMAPPMTGAAAGPGMQQPSVTDDPQLKNMMNVALQSKNPVQSIQQALTQYSQKMATKPGVKPADFMDIAKAKQAATPTGAAGAATPTGATPR